MNFGDKIVRTYFIPLLFLGISNNVLRIPPIVVLFLSAVCYVSLDPPILIVS